MNTEILNKRVEEIELKAFNEIKEKIKTKINQELSRDPVALASIFEILKDHNPMATFEDVEFVVISNGFFSENWETNTRFLKKMANFCIDYIEKHEIQNSKYILEVYLDMLGLSHIREYNLSCAGFLCYFEYDQTFKKYNSEQGTIYCGYDLDCYNFQMAEEFNYEFEPINEYNNDGSVYVNEYGVIEFVL